MLGTRLTALILAALSITALRAQDNTAAANHSPGGPAHKFEARPRIDVPNIEIPPPVMHLCIARCFPIVWDKDHYINFGPENTSIYTVERFTRNSIIMHRTDKGHFPLTATMTGQISADGNSMVNGRIDWTSGNSGSGPFTAKWGIALDDDVVAGQRRLLHIPCDASSNVSVEEANERAEQLMEANDLVNAACWLRISATQGDAEAQGALASILYRGVGVPINLGEAAIWADKAAAQGDFFGEHVLSNMYAKGDAKPKDPAKAESWRAKYVKDKLAYDRAQEQAKEAQRQRAQAQAQENAVAGMMMLQLLLGAFSADSDSPRSGSNVNGYNGTVMACHQGTAAACASIGEAPPNED
jgi:hypothetical protein